MNAEFNGIERRLSELNERLARLYPLQNKSFEEFNQDPYLRDIVERNLEVCIQSCLDICHRIISVENTRIPVDYYESIVIMGEIGILPLDFAHSLAPMAGFRNILIHEYVRLDWNRVYRYLQNLDDLRRFSELIRSWLEKGG
jgi:uncharacterized protein YutE (UPF0331/DUF86 family)